MRNAWARLLDALGLAAGVAFALIAAATAYDVMARAAAWPSINGLSELVEYTLFAATFLAAPWLLRHDGHVQVDFLLTALPTRSAARLRRAGDAIGLAVCLTLLVFSVRVLLQSRADRSLMLKTLIFPEWWLYAVIVVSMALLALEFLRRLIGARPPRR